MNTFGSRLKAFRESTGLSQVDFANKIGINQVNVTHWENNKNLPNSKKSVKITQAFPELNIDWLFNGTIPMLLEKSPKTEPLISQIQKWMQEKIEDQAKIIQAKDELIEELRNNKGKK